MTNKITLTFALMVTTMITSNAFAKQTKYYDSQGRLEKIMNGETIYATYEYNNDGSYIETNIYDKILYNSHGDTLKRWSTDEWNGIYDESNGMYLTSSYEYTYDNNGRKTSQNSISYDMGSAIYSDQTWTYVGFGNVTDYTTRGYDQYDMNPINGNAQNYHFNYTYDNDGNILTAESLEGDYNNGFQLKPSTNGWQYTNLSELFRFADEQAYEVKLTYVDGLLTTIEGTSDSTTQLTKGYDSDGNVVKECRYRKGSSTTITCHEKEYQNGRLISDNYYSCNPYQTTPCNAKSINDVYGHNQYLDAYQSYTYTYDDVNHTAQRCIVYSGACSNVNYFSYGVVQDEYGNVVEDQSYAYVYANPAWKTGSTDGTSTKTPRRIYTLEEANKIAGKVNRVSIKYR